MSRRARLNLNEPKPDVRVCEICGRRISMNQRGNKCRECLKASLFPKVKEYINSHPDANELTIADEFDIEKELVHEWIKEGRIEYKH